MTVKITKKAEMIALSENSGRVYLTISNHLNWQAPIKLTLLQQRQSIQLNPFIMVNLFTSNTTERFKIFKYN